MNCPFISKNHIRIVTKEDDFWDSVIKIGAAIGSAWLFLNILRNISPYTCPRCGAKLLSCEAKCQSCGLELYWGGTYG